METRIDEIGASIYRLSVFVPDAAPPAGFTFNHFLFAGLFHRGKRKMFSLETSRMTPTRTWRSPVPFAYMIRSTDVFDEKFLSGEGAAA